MKEEQINRLLEKYYLGDTSLEEEKLLKKELVDLPDMETDYEIFSYLNDESFVPQDLEEKVFSNIQFKEKSKRNNVIRILSISSVAAMLLVFFSVVSNKQSGYGDEKFTDEQKFAILEDALTHVSISLQPEDQDQVLIVYSDDNIEIVMN